jgi:hypothetical protein
MACSAHQLRAQPPACAPARAPPAASRAPRRAAPRALSSAPMRAVERRPSPRAPRGSRAAHAQRARPRGRLRRRPRNPSLDGPRADPRGALRARASRVAPRPRPSPAPPPHTVLTVIAPPARWRADHTWTESSPRKSTTLLLPGAGGAAAAAAGGTPSAGGAASSTGTARAPNEHLWCRATAYRAARCARDMRARVRPRPRRAAPGPCVPCRARPYARRAAPAPCVFAAAACASLRAQASPPPSVAPTPCPSRRWPTCPRSDVGRDPVPDRAARDPLPLGRLRLLPEVRLAQDLTRPRPHQPKTSPALGQILVWHAEQARSATALAVAQVVSDALAEAGLASSWARKIQVPDIGSNFSPALGPLLTSHGPTSLYGRYDRRAAPRCRRRRRPSRPRSS